MDWFKICKEYYDLKFYTNDTLKIFVVKNKITADEYKIIANIDYVA